MKDKFIPNIQLFAEGGDDKKFTQEEVNKMIEERVKNANLSAEEKHKKEIEKIQKDLEAKNAELSTIKTNELKKAALVKYKLPDSFLGSITGTTEEEIEASVKAFSENLGTYLKTQAAGVPGDMNGGSGEKDKKIQLEDLKKRALETGDAADRAAYVKAKNELEESGGNQ